MNRRIYIDFDDVLCHTARSLIDLLEREHGRRVEFDRIHTFDLGVSFNLAERELEDFMRLAHGREGLIGIEPDPGAASVLRDWHRRGYEVCIVTGRPASTREVSHDWLQSHAIPFDALMFMDKYGRAHLDADGHAALPLEDLPVMGFCFAVDDSPEMIAYLARHLDIPVAVMDRPWNAVLPPLTETERARVVRCADWSEIDACFNSRDTRGTTR